MEVKNDQFDSEWCVSRRADMITFQPKVSGVQKLSAVEAPFVEAIGWARNHQGSEVEYLEETLQLSWWACYDIHPHGESGCKIVHDMICHYLRLGKWAVNFVIVHHSSQMKWIDYLTTRFPQPTPSSFQFCKFTAVCVIMHRYYTQNCYVPHLRDLPRSLKDHHIQNARLWALS